MQHIEDDIIYEQINMIQKDIKVGAFKTGMLATENIIQTVSKAIRDFQLKNFVLDPVMVATSGDKLISDSAIYILKDKLIPQADIITPNIFEAEILASHKIENLKDMEQAAHKIVSMGAKNALIKGGHLNINNQSIDVMCSSKGKDIQHFEYEYIAKNKVHGTGCSLSAAIASYLALGDDLSTAVSHAKSFTYEGIQNAYALGKGSLVVSLV